MDVENNEGAVKNGESEAMVGGLCFCFFIRQFVSFLVKETRISWTRYIKQKVYFLQKFMI